MLYDSEQRKDSIKISKSFLDTREEFGAATVFNPLYDYNEAMKIYAFITTYSNVEWGCQGYYCDKILEIFISTGYSVEYSFGSPFLNRRELKSKSSFLVFDLHSHPFVGYTQKSFPSDEDHEYYKGFKSRKGPQIPHVFHIYDVNSKLLIEFDNGTYCELSSKIHFELYEHIEFRIQQIEKYLNSLIK